MRNKAVIEILWQCAAKQTSVTHSVTWWDTVRQSVTCVTVRHSVTCVTCQCHSETQCYMCHVSVSQWDTVLHVSHVSHNVNVTCVIHSVMCRTVSHVSHIVSNNVSHKNYIYVVKNYAQSWVAKLKIPVSFQRPVMDIFDSSHPFDVLDWSNLILGMWSIYTRFPRFGIRTLCTGPVTTWCHFHNLFHSCDNRISS